MSEYEILRLVWWLFLAVLLTGFAVMDSGTRTMWFAPDIGLVKLVFKHADGSVSTVVLTH